MVCWPDLVTESWLTMVPTETVLCLLYLWYDFPIVLEAVGRELMVGLLALEELWAAVE